MTVFLWKLPTTEYTRIDAIGRSHGRLIQGSGHVAAAEGRVTIRSSQRFSRQRFCCPVRVVSKRRERWQTLCGSRNRIQSLVIASVARVCRVQPEHLVTLNKGRRRIESLPSVDKCQLTHHYNFNWVSVEVKASRSSRFLFSEMNSQIRKSSTGNLDLVAIVKRGGRLQSSPEFKW